MAIKIKVTQDYSRLNHSVKKEIQAQYAEEDYEQNLIRYESKDGKTVRALRYETEDKIYLIRMSMSQAGRLMAGLDEEEEESIPELTPEKLLDDEVEEE